MFEGHPACRFQSDKPWLDLRLHPDGTIMKLDELKNYIQDPLQDFVLDDNLFDRIHGSMIGLTLGDSLGAHVEFRPRDFMVANPTNTLKGGGTWGLQKGQFTDDTSMALCLASSLITRKDFILYDQFVRYKWWYRNGYMSSTGDCFDIGVATRRAIEEFEQRQRTFAELYKIPLDQLDYLSDRELLNQFDVNCSESGVAGNGPLMRLAPVPLFFHRDPIVAVEYSGLSAQITHGDEKAVDACRYYGALIVAALRGESIEQLFAEDFYIEHETWFGGKVLHPEIMNIARGSFKKHGGYDDGIRGKGYVVDSLQAALWAFWKHPDSFEEGALAAVNLGDDTDTTAAIYGQLAGAVHGYSSLLKRWTEELYAKKFLACLSKWIAYEGKQWSDSRPSITEKVISTSFESSRSTAYEENSQKFVDFCSPIEHSSSSNNEPIKIYFSDQLNSCEDVRRWIESLNDDYQDEAPAFEKHNIDGYWLLNHITNDNLQKYGVLRADYRQSILNSIENFKQLSQVKTITLKT